jgi:hypothetical protein
VGVNGEAIVEPKLPQRWGNGLEGHFRPKFGRFKGFDGQVREAATGRCLRVLAVPGRGIVEVTSIKTRAPWVFDS